MVAPVLSRASRALGTLREELEADLETLILWRERLAGG